MTARIDAVTVQDIQRVARMLFRHDWLNLAVVGPFKAEGKFVQALAL